MGRPDYLSEWEFFVWRHRGLKNLIMHFISTSLFFIGLVAFFITYEWPYLILIPISQYAGFLGHKLFEDGGVRSRDFVSPVTLAHLFRIYFYISIRKYRSILEDVEEKVRVNNNGICEIKTLKNKVFYGH